MVLSVIFSLVQATSCSSREASVITLLWHMLPPLCWVCQVTAPEPEQIGVCRTVIISGSKLEHLRRSCLRSILVKSHTCNAFRLSVFKSCRLTGLQCLTKLYHDLDPEEWNTKG